MSSIKKLDETTINKIGAGEVIQRPVNVVKELIENSLDAHCHTINISIKSGGFGSITVTDDGDGINEQDLDLLCERYTSSKQLDNETYGFRGEALSCISYVSKVTVTTKPKSEQLARKAVYIDGKLQGSISLCAGGVGTTIVCEKLFEGMARKRGMKEGEEYRKIVNLVGAYAIHQSGIAFTLRKAGESGCDVRTNKTASSKDNISSIYGMRIAMELKSFEYKNDNPPVILNGLMSGSTFNSKKNEFLFFINERIIENANLKKEIESIWDELLPRVAVFVYLSVTIPNDRIDVNVNPSKTAARLLEEDKVMRVIVSQFKSLVANESQTTSFPTSQVPSQPKSQKGIIRVDSSTPSILAFTDQRSATAIQTAYSQNNSYIKNRSQNLMKNEEASEINETTPTQIQTSLSQYFESSKQTKTLTPPQTKPTQSINDIVVKRRPRKFSGSEIIGIQTLQQMFEVTNVDLSLVKEVKEMSFVGIVDQSYCIVQTQAALALMHIPTIIHDLVYQQVIYGIGQLSTVELDPPLKISDALNCIGLNHPHEIITKHQLLLLDYFSIGVSSNGEITSIPDVLPGYLPTQSAFPHFIKQLCEVDWETELECLHGVCSAIGDLFCILPCDVTTEENNRTVQNTLFPYVKQNLLPQNLYRTYAIVTISDLSELYKCFERC